MIQYSHVESILLFTPGSPRPQKKLLSHVPEPEETCEKIKVMGEVDKAACEDGS